MSKIVDLNDIEVAEGRPSAANVMIKGKEDFSIPFNREPSITPLYHYERGEHYYTNPSNYKNNGKNVKVSVEGKVLSHYDFKVRNKYLPLSVIREWYRLRDIEKNEVRDNSAKLDENGNKTYRVGTAEKPVYYYERWESKTGKLDWKDFTTRNPVRTLAATKTYYSIDEED